MRHTNYTTARALLGTATDASVAAQMAIPTSTLFHWRRKARIAPHRLHSSTARYLTLLRQHPEGLTARHVYTAFGITRQAAFLMLHALARREIVECVMLPNPRRYGGRAHSLCWRLLPEKGASPHAQTA